MAQADGKVDALYDGLRADFGETSPKASGYLSEYSFLRERALVLEVVGDEPGMVVDLACGTGLITLPLVKAGCRVIGVDFNAASCRQAGRNGLGAVRGDAFNLPLASGTADTVLNVEFAQQYDFQAVERMLQEAARVLRPSGRLVIVWANRKALVHRLLSAIFRILGRLRGRARFTLANHAPLEMQAAGRRSGLELDKAFAIFPPLSLRFGRIDGPLVSLIGSSFVAVFRKPAGS